MLLGLGLYFLVVILLVHDLEELLSLELLSGSAVVVDSGVDISGFELEGLLVLLFDLLESFLEVVLIDFDDLGLLESFDFFAVDSDHLVALGLENFVEDFPLALHHVVELELFLEHLLLFLLDLPSGGLVLHLLLELAVLCHLVLVHLAELLVDLLGDADIPDDLRSLLGVPFEVLLGGGDVLRGEARLDALDLVDDVLGLLRDVDQPVGGVDLLVLVSLDEVDEVLLEIDLAVDLGVLVLDQVHDTTSEFVLLDEVEDLFDLLELDGDVDLGDHDQDLVEDVVLNDVLVEAEPLVSLLAEEPAELLDLLGDSLEIFLVILEEAVDFAHLFTGELEVVVDALELVDHVLFAEDSLVFVEDELFELVLLLVVDSVVLEGVGDRQDSQEQLVRLLLEFFLLDLSGVEVLDVVLEVEEGMVLVHSGVPEELREFFVVGAGVDEFVLFFSLHLSHEEVDIFEALEALLVHSELVAYSVGEESYIDIALDGFGAFKGDEVFLVGLVLWVSVEEVSLVSDESLEFLDSSVLVGEFESLLDGLEVEILELGVSLGVIDDALVSVPEHFHEVFEFVSDDSLSLVERVLKEVFAGLLALDVLDGLDLRFIEFSDLSAESFFDKITVVA